MRATTEHDIRDANAAGVRHAGTDTYWSYQTPDLQVAYDLGQQGLDLAAAPVVSGWRYGSAPVSGRSRNYMLDRPENGVSLACVDGEPEIGSGMWFAERPRVAVSGVLSGRGSDGEALIVLIGREYQD